MDLDTESDIKLDLEIGRSKFQGYVETYGKPPAIIETFKDPSKLWGIQEDILKFAAGKGNEAQHTVDQIYEVLKQHNIFVLESMDETLELFDANELVRQSHSESIGGFQRILIGTPEYYMENSGLSERQARHYQWRLLGHAAGHAIDKKAYPNITKWGTEIRQQMFNQIYAQTVGDTVLEDEQMKFFIELENAGVKFVSSRD